MGIDNSEYINVTIVIFFIAAFNIFCLYAINRVKHISGKEPLFERSEHLLLLANIVNFLESILNILYGTVKYISYSENFEWDMSFFALATFSTRFYASCMGLRIYRIKHLHSLRSGTRPNSKLCQISTNFSLITTNLYSAFTTSVYFLIYFYFDHKYASVYYIQLLYSAESIFMLISSYLVFSQAKHPSIPVEYVFYSVIWITGVVNSGVYRTLYLIPIRNSLLLLVSIQSIYSHIEVLRPYLPHELNFENLFEIKEVYLDFKEFLMEHGNKKEIEGFQVYSGFKIMGMGDELHKYARKYLAEGEINRDVSCEIGEEYAKDHLETSLTEIKSRYLKSNKYKNLRKKYFIEFN